MSSVRVPPGALMHRLFLVAVVVATANVLLPEVSAAGPPTFRQQAARACQTFYEQTLDLDAEAALSEKPWNRARRVAAFRLRRSAALSERTDDRLAAIRPPRASRGRWARMIAGDRAANRVLRQTASRLATADPRTGVRVYEAGMARYRRTVRRFYAQVEALRLTGCRELEPTADLGRDPRATPARRREARALTGPGAALDAAGRQQRATIIAALQTARDCGDLALSAPTHAQQRAEELRRAAVLGAYYGPVGPALMRHAAEISAVALRDRALRRGRAALLERLRVIAALPAAGDPCPSLRAWAQQGWAPEAAPAAPVEPDALFDTDLERRQIALARRLRALGVSPTAIRRLVGETVVPSLRDLARRGLPFPG